MVERFDLDEGGFLGERGRMEPSADGDYVRHSDYADLERQNEELRKERDEARGIVRDIHWMAVRYADNRKSYAVGMCNDALRKAYEGGWLVYQDGRQHDLDPQYARDGMFDVEWRSALDNATARADALAQEVEGLRGLLGYNNGKRE